MTWRSRLLTPCGSSAPNPTPLHQSGVKWCKSTVEFPMDRKIELDAGLKAVRASVTFSGSVYADLERLATAKKVSLAWLIREAAERYIADQWPLFDQERRNSHS